MDTRNRIIDQIFKILAPLRTSYKEEIDKVTNDLLIGYTDSLDNFINKYYGNISYSPAFVSLITLLVNQGIVSPKYLDEMNTSSEIYKQISVRPLNVKIATFNNILRHKNLTNLDLTKFPISLIQSTKEVNEQAIPSINPNLTPLEITPNENSNLDIVLPSQDINEEMPNFENFKPEVEPINNIPPIAYPAVEEQEIKVPTIETQPVISKDEIFNSLNNNPVVEENNSNPDLKHTSQFGQLLQFPLDNQNEVKLETNSPLQENITPLVQENVPVQNSYISSPMVEEKPITVSLPESEVNNNVDLNENDKMPEINQSVPVQNPYISLPIVEEKPITVSLPEPEVNNNVDLKEDDKKTETSQIETPNVSYSKEQLNEEIAAKVREEVKKQVTKEITEQIRLEEKNNIVRIQNDYMNNANLFIQELNQKSEEEIYMSLRYLNDLKYMSHCIAHLNMNTLERFYRFIEDKINSPKSEFMDGFIEKRIRENLPNSLIDEIDEETKKIV